MITPASFSEPCSPAQGLRRPGQLVDWCGPGLVHKKDLSTFCGVRLGTVSPRLPSWQLSVLSDLTGRLDTESPLPWGPFQAQCS